MNHRLSNRGILTALPWLALTLSLPLGGCGDENRAGEASTHLRIGVLPDDSVEALRGRYRPLVSYLERTIGVPCELEVPDSYESLLSSFRRGEIDVAYFGGFTFVAARDLAGAVPLVLRTEDRHFVSVYIVSGASTAESIDDLAGSRLAFGSRLSTSGHLMPRSFLEEQGITPEQFFGEIRYTGSHDATVRAVRDGDADLGFVNALIVAAMLRDGRFAAEDVRILGETPPYVDYVWAARRDLPEALQASVVDAFLALDPWCEEHREILRGLDARAYYPATSGEFQNIASIVQDLGLLEDLR